MNSPKMKKIVIEIVCGVVFLMILGVTGYVFASIRWSYSKGERVGYIQKFTEKGWVNKTWEGELQMLPVPGAMPEKFVFSVRKKDVIGKLNSSLGKKIAVSYEQHKGAPSKIFGESEYFIVDVKSLE